MRHIDATFYLPDQHLFAESIAKRNPDFMWGNGITFSAMLGAARHDPKTWRPRVESFFTAMNRYWDAKAKIPGYEPAPTNGGGNDKYYDDNAWMVLTFLEAYEMTHDRRYLERASATLEFCLSGWDEAAGGGIWWHERHLDGTKNTCINAPAAVACIRIARYQPPAKAKASLAMARKLIDWTTRTLQDSDGLFDDRVKVESGQVIRGKLTYNSALMIRAYLGMYRAAGDERDLAAAKRCAKACDAFVDERPGDNLGAYRDSVKWSHLLVEADLEMYRATGDRHLFDRATRAAAVTYEAWIRNKPDTQIDNAAIARMLWLLSEAQSDEGRAFWKRVDGE